MKAAEVVAERGFENTRFSDVAERSDTSVSTLQYLFGNREDLVVGALREHARRLLEAAERRSAEIVDPLARLRWVADHLAAHEDDAESARTEWILWVEYWRAALRDDELAEESIGSYGGWLQLVREAIEAAVAAGAIAAPTDLDGVAQGACAIADGLGIQIALRRPGIDWQRAGALTRAWLAAALNCPDIAT